MSSGDYGDYIRAFAGSELDMNYLFSQITKQPIQEKTNLEILQENFSDFFYKSGIVENNSMANLCAAHTIEFANQQCEKLHKLLLDEIKDLKDRELEFRYKEEKYLEELATLNSIMQNTNEETVCYADVVELKRELKLEKERNRSLAQREVSWPIPKGVVEPLDDFKPIRKSPYADEGSWFGDAKYNPDCDYDDKPF